ncbi:hypothetical protein LEMLEM_LOCUS10691 [Lemmus lemmus]
MDVDLQPPERQGIESSCQSPDSSLPNRPKEPELLFLMLALGSSSWTPPFPQLKGPKVQQDSIQHCPQCLFTPICENSIGTWACPLLSPVSKMVPTHSVINQILVT